MKKETLLYFLVGLVCLEASAIPTDQISRETQAQEVIRREKSIRGTHPSSLTRDTTSGSILAQHATPRQHPKKLFLSRAHHNLPFQRHFLTDLVQLVGGQSVPLLSPIEILQIPREAIVGSDDKLPEVLSQPEVPGQINVPQPKLVSPNTGKPRSITEVLVESRDLTNVYPLFKRGRIFPYASHFSQPTRVIYERVPVIIEIVDRANEDKQLPATHEIDSVSHKSTTIAEQPRLPTNVHVGEFDDQIIISEQENRPASIESDQIVDTSDPSKDKNAEIDVASDKTLDEISASQHHNEQVDEEVSKTIDKVTISEQKAIPTTVENENIVEESISSEQQKPPLIPETSLINDEITPPVLSDQQNLPSRVEITSIVQETTKSDEDMMRELGENKTTALDDQNLEIISSNEQNITSGNQHLQTNLESFKNEETVNTSKPVAVGSVIDGTKTPSLPESFQKNMTQETTIQKETERIKNDTEVLEVVEVNIPQTPENSVGNDITTTSLESLPSIRSDIQTLDLTRIPSSLGNDDLGFFESEFRNHFSNQRFFDPTELVEKTTPRNIHFRALDITIPSPKIPSRTDASKSFETPPEELDSVVIDKIIRGNMNPEEVLKLGGFGLRLNPRKTLRDQDTPSFLPRQRFSDNLDTKELTDVTKEFKSLETGRNRNFPTKTIDILQKNNPDRSIPLTIADSTLIPDEKRKGKSLSTSSSLLPSDHPATLEDDSSLSTLIKPNLDFSLEGVVKMDTNKHASNFDRNKINLSTHSTTQPTETLTSQDAENQSIVERKNKDFGSRKHPMPILLLIKDDKSIENDQALKTTTSAAAKQKTHTMDNVQSQNRESFSRVENSQEIKQRPDKLTSTIRNPNSNIPLVSFTDLFTVLQPPTRALKDDFKSKTKDSSMSFTILSKNDKDHVSSKETQSFNSSSQMISNISATEEDTDKSDIPDLNIPVFDSAEADNKTTISSKEVIIIDKIISHLNETLSEIPELDVQKESKTQVGGKVPLPVELNAGKALDTIALNRLISENKNQTVKTINDTAELPPTKPIHLRVKIQIHAINNEEIETSQSPVTESSISLSEMSLMVDDTNSTIPQEELETTTPDYVETTFKMTDDNETVSDITTTEAPLSDDDVIESLLALIETHPELALSLDNLENKEIMQLPTTEAVVAFEDELTTITNLENKSDEQTTADDPIIAENKTDQKETTDIPVIKDIEIDLQKITDKSVILDQSNDQEQTPDKPAIQEIEINQQETTISPLILDHDDDQQPTTDITTSQETEIVQQELISSPVMFKLADDQQPTPDNHLIQEIDINQQETTTSSIIRDKDFNQEPTIQKVEIDQQETTTEPISLDQDNDQQSTTDIPTSQEIEIVQQEIPIIPIILKQADDQQPTPDILVKQDIEIDQQKTTANPVILDQDNNQPPIPDKPIIKKIEIDQHETTDDSIIIGKDDGIPAIQDIDIEIVQQETTTSPIILDQNNDQQSITDNLAIQESEIDQKETTTNIAILETGVSQEVTTDELIIEEIEINPKTTTDNATILDIEIDQEATTDNPFIVLEKEIDQQETTNDSIILLENDQQITDSFTILENEVDQLTTTDNPIDLDKQDGQQVTINKPLVLESEEQITTDFINLKDLMDENITTEHPMKMGSQVDDLLNTTDDLLNLDQLENLTTHDFIVFDRVENDTVEEITTSAPHMKGLFDFSDMFTSNDDESFKELVEDDLNKTQSDKMIEPLETTTVFLDSDDSKEKTSFINQTEQTEMELALFFLATILERTTPPPLTTSNETTTESMAVVETEPFFQDEGAGQPIQSEFQLLMPKETEMSEIKPSQTDTMKSSSDELTDMLVEDPTILLSVDDETTHRDFIKPNDITATSPSSTTFSSTTSSSSGFSSTSTSSTTSTTTSPSTSTATSTTTDTTAIPTTNPVTADTDTTITSTTTVPSAIVNTSPTTIDIDSTSTSSTSSPSTSANTSPTTIGIDSTSSSTITFSTTTTTESNTFTVRPQSFNDILFGLHRQEQQRSGTSVKLPFAFKKGTSVENLDPNARVEITVVSAKKSVRVSDFPLDRGVNNKENLDSSLEKKETTIDRLMGEFKSEKQTQPSNVKIIDSLLNDLQVKKQQINDTTLLGKSISGAPLSFNKEEKEENIIERISNDIKPKPSGQAEKVKIVDRLFNTFEIPQHSSKEGGLANFDEPRSASSGKVTIEDRATTSGENENISLEEKKRIVVRKFIENLRRVMKNAANSEQKAHSKFERDLAAVLPKVNEILENQVKKNLGNSTEEEIEKNAKLNLTINKDGSIPISVLKKIKNALEIVAQELDNSKQNPNLDNKEVERVETQSKEVNSNVDDIFLIEAIKDKLEQTSFADSRTSETIHQPETLRTNAAIKLPPKRKGLLIRKPVPQGARVVTKIRRLGNKFGKKNKAHSRRTVKKINIRPLSSKVGNYISSKVTRPSLPSATSHANEEISDQIIPRTKIHSDEQVSPPSRNNNEQHSGSSTVFHNSQEIVPSPLLASTSLLKSLTEDEKTAEDHQDQLKTSNSQYHYRLSFTDDGEQPPWILGSPVFKGESQIPNPEDSSHSMPDLSHKTQGQT